MHLLYKYHKCIVLSQKSLPHLTVSVRKYTAAHKEPSLLVREIFVCRGSHGGTAALFFSLWFLLQLLSDLDLLRYTSTPFNNSSQCVNSIFLLKTLTSESLGFLQVC